MQRFQRGDRVVYRKTKVSSRPGQRARSVYPSQHGEEYSYLVDKFWIVVREVDAKTIEVRTRRGKVHRLDRRDPHLRKARILDQVFHGRRFPGLPTTV